MIIDDAVGGQFSAAYHDAPGRFTLREEVRRHTWFSPFFDWLLNFLMGQDIDTPTTVWQEMFLPQEFADRLLEFSYVDEAGQERKIVKEVEVLNRAVDRPPVLDAPRRQWPYALALGLAAAALLGCLLVLSKKKPVARVVLGISQSLLGLFFGGVGTVLFFMTFFTNHDYTYHNANVIFVNPLLLAAIPLGIMLARNRSPGREPQRLGPTTALHLLWAYVFLAGFASILIKLLPWFWQQNQVTQALVLPIAFVLSGIPQWLWGKIRGARRSRRV
jgi:hypothetical protein